MKEITIFEANDGRRFDDRGQCEDYESAGCVEFKPVPDYGDHVLFSEESARWMSNGDGSVYYATATHYAPRHSFGRKRPDWATHLIYFSK